MYDLVLKAGRVIDPAQGLDAVCDVAFADGRVAALGADLREFEARARCGWTDRHPGAD